MSDSDSDHKEPTKKRKSPPTKKKQAASHPLIDELAADTIKLRECLKTSSMLVTNAALEGKRVNQLLDGLRHQRERIERETELEKKAIEQLRSALEVKKRLYEEHERLFQQWEQRLRSVLVTPPPPHPALPDGSSSSSDPPLANGDVPAASSAAGGKTSTPGQTYRARISRQQTLSPSSASTGFDFIRTATVFSQERFDALSETF